VLGGELLDGALAHRLREGVVVRPAERLRPRTPVLHEALGDPGLAALLGVVGDGLGARASVLGPRLAQERIEDLRLAARSLDVLARAERQLRLRGPIDAVI